MKRQRGHVDLRFIFWIMFAIAVALVLAGSALTGWALTFESLFLVCLVVVVGACLIVAGVYLLCTIL